jgi:hypothetical protein
MPTPAAVSAHTSEYGPRDLRIRLEFAAGLLPRVPLRPERDGNSSEGTSARAPLALDRWVGARRRRREDERRQPTWRACLIYRQQRSPALVLL